VSPEPFAYPTIPHVRRHGPLGYLDYRAFKPWLRDDFTFRCVYCLFRERWYPNGQDSFSVDHLVAQALALERVWDYSNLAYACVRCNSRKRACWLPDPCTTPYGDHLRVREDGTVTSLTAEGARLIEFLILDDPEFTEYRRRILDVIRRVLAGSPQGTSEVAAWMGFPEDLPDLAALRPPGGNSRPAGAEGCYFAQRQRGEIPEVY
jgi:hypothetical protein